MIDVNVHENTNIREYLHWWREYYTMLQFRLHVYTQADLLKMPPIIIIASMDDTSLCYWKVLHPYFIAISKLLYGICYWIQE